MNNKIIVMAIIVTLVVIGYFASSGKEKTEIVINGHKKDTLPLVCQPLMTADISSCAVREVVYGHDKASVVSLKGNNIEKYQIVFVDGSNHLIETPLFFDFIQPLKDYVKKTNGFDLTDTQIEKIMPELRLGKRGWLLGVPFDSFYEGTIFINQQGQFSGQLKKK